MTNKTGSKQAIIDETLKELEAMNLSEEDAILKGLDEMEENEATEEEVSEPKPDSEKPKGEADKPRYSKEELLRIFDTMLFEGEYREVIKIGKNYSVKLRSRSVGESNDITRKVDALDLKTFLAVQNFTNVITLAYALCEINSKNMMDMSFSERYAKVKELPEGLIIILSGKLFEFDQKVLEAMKAGQENF